MSYSFWRPPTLAPGGACPLPLATPLFTTELNVGMIILNLSVILVTFFLYFGI